MMTNEEYDAALEEAKAFLYCGTITWDFWSSLQPDMQAVFVEAGRSKMAEMAALIARASKPGGIQEVLGIMSDDVAARVAVENGLKKMEEHLRTSGK